MVPGRAQHPRQVTGRVEASSPLLPGHDQGIVEPLHSVLTVMLGGGGNREHLFKEPVGMQTRHPWTDEGRLGREAVEEVEPLGLRRREGTGRMLTMARSRSNHRPGTARRPRWYCGGGHAGVQSGRWSATPK